MDYNGPYFYLKHFTKIGAAVIKADNKLVSKKKDKENTSLLN